MPRLLNSITALVLVSALFVHADERPTGVPSEARWVKVDRVTDGDTIVLMDRTRVRLHGIDAPEQDQPYGSAATKALEHMVGDSAYMIQVDEDRYGRLVGQLFNSIDRPDPLPGGVSGYGSNRHGPFQRYYAWTLATQQRARRTLVNREPKKKFWGVIWGVPCILSP